MRVGFGFDVHALASGRSLIIGGVKIPYEVGLLGHSDADVLLHAIMDALLGAAGLGDIGQHFPDSDPQYKDIASTLLLERVAHLLKLRSLVCHNLDCTLVAQAPKIAPYREEIRNNVARCLGIEPSYVNIKATTSEGLGFTGRKEGMAAYAICSICEI